MVPIVARSLVVLMLALVAAVAVPAQAAVPLGHPGPHAGVAVEGATNTHVYSSDVLANPCIPLIAQFIVTLAHEPSGYVLLLEAGGAATESVEGEAVVRFYASWCTTFTIEVTGIDVPDAAVYALTVERVTGA